jgi:hypothetical protein
LYLEKKDRYLEITWSKQNESGNEGMENNYKETKSTKCNYIHARLYQLGMEILHVFKVGKWDCCAA